MHWTIRRKKIKKIVTLDDCPLSSVSEMRRVVQDQFLQIFSRHFQESTFAVEKIRDILLQQHDWIHSARNLVPDTGLLPGADAAYPIQLRKELRKLLKTRMYVLRLVLFVRVSRHTRVCDFYATIRSTCRYSSAGCLRDQCPMR